ncbi:MAG TPA: flippase [bacterium]|nr:flippase [bacterium]
MEIRERVVLKNAGYNIAGELVTVLLGIVTVPLVVRTIGVDRYGVLSIAQLFVGYFGLIELGLGQAVTRFVAETVARGSVRLIRPVVWTAAAAAAGLGVLGALGLDLITPVIVTRLLHLPPGLIGETAQLFYAASVLIALVVVTNTLRGVLEAYQRFGWVNAVRIPSDLTGAGITLIGLLVFGITLPQLFMLLAAKNLAVLLVYLVLVKQSLPVARAAEAGQVAGALSALLRYGSWIALQNIAVTILLYLERLLVAASLAIAAVSYYSIPQGLANRALVVPASLMPVLFPVVSGLPSHDAAGLQVRFARAFKYLALTMGFLAATMLTFAPEILMVWVGPEFLRGTAVLRIAGVGVLVSSVAWLSGTFLQALGDARTVTIIHLVQIPFYAAATWFLVRGYGINGAAVSWTLRIIVSAALLLAAGRPWKFVNVRMLVENRSAGYLGILGLLCVAILAFKSAVPTPAGSLIALGAFLAGSLANVWGYAMDDREKAFVTAAVRGAVPARFLGRSHAS